MEGELRHGHREVLASECGESPSAKKGNHVVSYGNRSHLRQTLTPVRKFSLELESSFENLFFSDTKCSSSDELDEEGYFSKVFSPNLRVWGCRASRRKRLGRKEDYGKENLRKIHSLLKTTWKRKFSYRLSEEYYFTQGLRKKERKNLWTYSIRTDPVSKMEHSRRISENINLKFINLESSRRIHKNYNNNKFNDAVKINNNSKIINKISHDEAKIINSNQNLEINLLNKMKMEIDIKEEEKANEVKKELFKLKLLKVRDTTCNKCGQRGHLAKGCVNIVCNVCKSLNSHYTKECPLLLCDVCKDRHSSRNCPEALRKNPLFKKKCPVCHLFGHDMEECGPLKAKQKFLEKNLVKAYGAASATEITAIEKEMRALSLRNYMGFKPEFKPRKKKFTYKKWKKNRKWKKNKNK